MTAIATAARGSGPFPVDLLDGCADALFLFGAGFLGANDAYHAAAAGVRGTVVDIDARALQVMSEAYPDEWEWFCWDALAFVEQNIGVRQWDLVSADPFTGDAAEMCASRLGDLLSLARQALVLTVGRDQELPAAPAGWRMTTMDRTVLANWMVFTRG